MNAPGSRCEPQAAAAILMVAPAAFGFNAEAAASNVFAAPPGDDDVAAAARREWEGAVRALEEAGAAVHVLEDSAEPAKPDAIFPNNWLTTHADGTIVTYPMAHESRRAERRPEAVRAMLRSAGFAIARHVDLAAHEARGDYLEGTGSLVLDRARRRAFAALGPRTHEAPLADFAARLGYEVHSFRAVDPGGRPVYHTNVAVSLGRRFALACLDCVAEAERDALAGALEAGGRELIRIGWGQLARFAGNVIELENRRGETFVALSASAQDALRPEQRAALRRLSGPLVAAPLPVVERVAGGSMRCMIAEIFLPRAR
ncbi:MAG: arginine deiminase-related protein [Sphingomonadaceae bacterium]